METPQIIRGLATLRLEEAEILIQHNKPDGAFYLAGYSVELMLKARIAERLGIPSLFADKIAVVDEFTDIGKLKSLVQTHNLDTLLAMAGLKQAFDQEKLVRREFLKFEVLLKTWTEKWRYRSPGDVEASSVQSFIQFLASPDGLLSWIAKQ